MMEMKFFDSIEVRSRQLFYATCSDMARLNLDYDDGNQYKVIIMNMKEMRSKLKLPTCQLNRDEDFTNYTLAIENANLCAVRLFTELGCDPFNQGNVFHDRLFEKERSIIELLKELKNKMSIIDLGFDSKKNDLLKNMIEWLDQKFTDLIASSSCSIQLMSSL